MTLELIGQKLKAAREAQGLSLRQIYERTKIPINHLQAIDSGLPDDLPEPVYVSGFIKLYAECIGLDGQVLSDEYRRSASSAGNGKNNKQASAQPVYMTAEYLKHARIDQRPPSWKLWPFWAVTAVAVIIVVSAISNYSRNPMQTDSGVQSLQQSEENIRSSGQSNITAPTPANPTTASTGTSTSTTTDANTSTEPGKVALSATQHVWLEVKRLSNDEDLYRGYLEQGDKKEFQDSQGLRVRAGNAGSVSVEFKGKIEPFGQPGKVFERTFTFANQAATGTAVPEKSASNGTGASSAAASAVSTDTIRKVRKPAEAPVAKLAVKRRHPADEGTRPIPGDSVDRGTRAIDVPYRYSEGRLDAN